VARPTIRNAQRPKAARIKSVRLPDASAVVEFGAQERVNLILLTQCLFVRLMSGSATDIDRLSSCPAALANGSQIDHSLKAAPLVFGLRGMREGLSVLHSCLDPCRNRRPGPVPDRHSQQPMSSQ